MSSSATISANSHSFSHASHAIPFSSSAPLPSSAPPAAASFDPSTLSVAAMAAPMHAQPQSQSQPSSQKSFTMSQQSQNGMSSYGQYPGNGMTHHNDPPQIYSAVYSGVDVYEMTANNVAVMRRRNDGWLNATQILKVAGVDKGKRTKILEKEIQTGEHEKVQGGYGKYQGTWIKFERGVEVCQQYGVEDLLQPLLSYEMRLEKGTDTNTPTKEQAMAAQRKRMYNSGADNPRQNGGVGTFFKNISSTASNAVAAISKARFDSPGPRNNSRAGPGRPPSFSRQPSVSHSVDDFPGNSQQSFASDFGSQHVDSAYSTQQTHMPAELSEPPRKRSRMGMLNTSDSFMYGGSNAEFYAGAFPGSPTEPNESFIYSQAGVQDQIQDGTGPLQPLPFELSPEAEKRRNTLLGLFVESKASEQSQLDTISTFSPRELDMPIDNHCNTVLHWAASLSRLSLLRALIGGGASPCRVNASGQTALMKACTVTNSMELASFTQLLDVLGSTLEMRDNKGRTVLHHIAVTSAVKGRNAASRYYLESLLGWVVRQGSVPNSQATGANSSSRPPSSQSQPPKMGIARFMAEIVNAQDNSGDTALNIAAKNGNRSVISQLLEVGADPFIANRSGLRPIDFGIGGEAGEGSVLNGDSLVERNGLGASSQRSKESADQIVNSISLLLGEASADFQKEVKDKQASLEALHSSIRGTSGHLAEGRRKLEALQASLRKQQLLRQQIANLTNYRDDPTLELLRAHSDSTLQDSQVAWDAELGRALEAASKGNLTQLPSGAILRARINALNNRREVTRTQVQNLQSKSRDIEVKYRQVVSLCTKVPESEVDGVIDALLRAVESEKGDLEIGRVRRFLGGVDGVVR